MTGGEDFRDGIDPTRMTNQPALRTSSGLVWLVMGGLFAAVVVAVFGMLLLAPGSRSGGVATASALIVLGLYAAMLVARIAIRRRPLRLRVMAGCMLAMAAVSLLGMWLCALVERAPT